ncbi:MAG: hypothetical protein QJR13_05095 [Bacillota bacterium]|nr:hypothetical protein [Bacillota bacterium]
MFSSGVIGAIVVAVVTWAEQRGVAKEIAPFLGIGLGILLNVLNALMTGGQNLWTAALHGIVIALSALGLIQVGKASVGIARWRFKKDEECAPPAEPPEKPPAQPPGGAPGGAPPVAPPEERPTTPPRGEAPAGPPPEPPGE